MKITALGKLKDLHPGIVTRMFIAYSFVLAYNQKQLETREMNNTGFHLYNVRLFSSENQCPPVVLCVWTSQKIIQNENSNLQKVMCHLMSLILISQTFKLVNLLNRLDNPYPTKS